MKFELHRIVILVGALLFTEGQALSTSCFTKAFELKHNEIGVVSPCQRAENMQVNTIFAQAHDEVITTAIPKGGVSGFIAVNEQCPLESGKLDVKSARDVPTPFHADAQCNNASRTRCDIRVDELGPKNINSACLVLKCNIPEGCTIDASVLLSVGFDLKSGAKAKTESVTEATASSSSSSMVFLYVAISLFVVFIILSCFRKRLRLQQRRKRLEEMRNEHPDFVTNTMNLDVTIVDETLNDSAREERFQTSSQHGDGEDRSMESTFGQFRNIALPETDPVQGRENEEDDDDWSVSEDACFYLTREIQDDLLRSAAEIRRSLQETLALPPHTRLASAA